MNISGCTFILKREARSQEPEVRIMTILRVADFEPRARASDPVFCVLPTGPYVRHNLRRALRGAAPFGAASRSPRLHWSLVYCQENPAPFSWRQEEILQFRAEISCRWEMLPVFVGRADPWGYLARLHPEEARQYSPREKEH